MQAAFKRPGAAGSTESAFTVAVEDWDAVKAEDKILVHQVGDD